MSEVNAFIYLVFFICIAMNILFGFICAHLAFNKNRSPLGWFIIGFFLSIIGIAIIAVASKLEVYDDDQPRTNTSNDKSDYIDCPFCAERIKRLAKLCRYCNSSLTTKSAPEEKQFEEQLQRKMWAKLFELTNNEAIRFASSSAVQWQCICGASNSDSASHCGKCDNDKNEMLLKYTKDAIVQMLNPKTSV